VQRYLEARRDLQAVAAAQQAAFLDHVLEPGDTSQIRRGAQRFALVAAGGELAAQMDIVPWPAGAAIEAAAKLFRVWAAAFGRKVQHEDQEAITRLRSFVQRYEHARFRPLRKPGDGEDELFDEAKGRARGAREAEARSLDAAGWREDKDGAVLFHIFPEYWRTDIFPGIDALSAARAVRDKGFLIVNPGRLTHRVSIGNAKQSFYTVRGSIMDDEGEVVRGFDPGEPKGLQPRTDISSQNQMPAAHGSQVHTVRISQDESAGDDWEERAAVLEHDGGFSREEAEKRARSEPGKS
jgi:putative DNA primase/helicase